MHIVRTSFNGTPNVGLYGYATDKALFIGESIPKKVMLKAKEALGDVEVRHFKIAGVDLPGLFLAGNSSTLLVPSIIFEKEEQQLKEAGIPYKILQTEQTCLGNNIACNDNGAIISTDFTDKEEKEIGELLGVPTLKLDIAGLPTPGAFLILNGEHGIIHRDATEEEIAKIENLLKVKLQPATVNLGTPYLRAGIINNSHGLVVGDASGGPEIVHIDEALGYEDEE